MAGVLDHDVCTVREAPAYFFRLVRRRVRVERAADEQCRQRRDHGRADLEVGIDPIQQSIIDAYPERVIDAINFENYEATFAKPVPDIRKIIWHEYTNHDLERFNERARLLAEERMRQEQLRLQQQADAEREATIRRVIRIANESNEAIVKASGNDARQRFFETDDGYRERMHLEAIESIIEAATGDAPSKGFLKPERATKSG